jgi:hypothetical protein
MIGHHTVIRDKEIPAAGSDANGGDMIKENAAPRRHSHSGCQQQVTERQDEWSDQDGPQRTGCVAGEGVGRSRPSQTEMSYFPRQQAWRGHSKA